MNPHGHPGVMWLARLGALVIGGTVVVWPLLAVALGGGNAGDEGAAAGGWILSLRTAGLAMGIASLATLAGLPGAWLVWRRGWAWGGLVALPLFGPAYLVSSGLNILRAPATWTGDWLGELSRGGAQWPTLWAGRALAIIGLAVWASPMAAFIIGAGLRTVDDETVEAMRLESGRWRAGVGVLRCVRPFVLGAFGLVTVMMLGSAVPLHLAQFKTVALLAWMTLQETGSAQRAAWAAAPLVASAAAAGCVVAWLLVRTPTPESSVAPAPRRRIGLVGAAAAAWVVGPGVALPFGLFASQIRSAGALERFWVESGPAVTESGLIAAVVGLVCGAVALAVWRVGSRAAVAGMTVLFVTGALVPGVLVGCAWRIAWPEGWEDSRLLIVLAHATRFGVAGVFGGVLLMRIDDQATREMMAVDGVRGVGAWWRASGARLVAPWMLSVLVGAVLSFNEIEAAVVVQAAGAMSLPQRLLNDLHQLRMEAMSAAAVWLMGVAAAVAAVVLLLSRGVSWAPKPRRSDAE